jgi:hypothetical protein
MVSESMYVAERRTVPASLRDKCFSEAPLWAYPYLHGDNGSRTTVPQQKPSEARLARVVRIRPPALQRF